MNQLQNLTICQLIKKGRGKCDSPCDPKYQSVHQCGAACWRALSLSSSSWKRFLLPLASSAGFPSGLHGLNCSLPCVPLPVVPLETIGLLRPPRSLLKRSSAPLGEECLFLIQLCAVTPNTSPRPNVMEVMTKSFYLQAKQQQMFYELWVSQGVN